MRGTAQLDNGARKWPGIVSFSSSYVLYIIISFIIGGVVPYIIKANVYSKRNKY